jgi:hypothetical protein
MAIPLIAARQELGTTTVHACDSAAMEQLKAQLGFRVARDNFP